MQTLTEWLTDTRRRGATITITNGRPTTRPFMPTDREPLQRHAHALTVAAAGTHPAWWNHIARHEPPPHVDGIPTVPCPASADDGLAFACATCGQPATTIDTQLLAWCDTHA